MVSKTFFLLVLGVLRFSSMDFQQLFILQIFESLVFTPNLFASSRKKLSSSLSFGFKIIVSIFLFLLHKYTKLSRFLIFSHTITQSDSMTKVDSKLLVTPTERGM